MPFLPESVPNSCQAPCPPCQPPTAPDALDKLTVRDVLYIGTHARLVALDNGVALEVLDSGNIWQRQAEWIEA